MFLPKSDSTNFELTPAGTFTARCYRFIDLGSHEQKYQGESKGLKRLVMIGFELVDEFMSDGRPFSIHKRYTWSTHEKSAMRKDLESWRGAKFNENDFGEGGFNVRNLLGVPCTLTIVHQENGDSNYANIASIGKVMKGIQLPDQINPSVFFGLERSDFNQPVFDGLSEKLKDFIRTTPEWQRLHSNGKSYADQSAGSSYDERNPPHSDSIDDQEIPF